MSQTELEAISAHQPRPTKSRRVGNYSVPTEFGPVDPDQQYQRGLGHIFLTAENERALNERHNNLINRLRSLAHIPRGSSSTLLAHQIKYSAEHEDLAGDYYSPVLRSKAISRLRNEVPELSAYENVSFDHVNNFWLVDVDSARYHQPDLPLFVGQCPIFIRESRGTIVDGQYFLMDAHVNPRAIVDDGSCKRIAKAFPSSIGMRVYTFGLIEIFYPSEKKIRLDLKTCQKFPYDIAGLVYTLVVVEVRQTSGLPPRTSPQKRNSKFPSTEKKVELSTPVASTPNALVATGCVGLRIRREGDSEDTWTTVTHAWSELPPISGMGKGEWLWRMNKANVVALRRRVERFLLKDKSAESSSDTQHQKAAAAVASGKEYRRVIGTTVYVAASDIKIGKITHCYDNLPLPESTLISPFGFDHDLSLISADQGEALPAMLNPTNYARPENKFVSPNEILGEKSPQAFHAYYNFYKGERIWAGGHIVTGAARHAVITGSEYWWEQRHLKIKRSIIWRTIPDDMSLGGGSGGVICLGNPAARTCRAALFQNYESRTMKSNTFWKKDARRTLWGFSRGCSYKGGFLLPADVQAATIVFDSPGPERRISSTPASKSATKYFPMSEAAGNPDFAKANARARRKQNATD